MTWLLRQETFGGMVYSPESGSIRQVNKAGYLALMCAAGRESTDLAVEGARSVEPRGDVALLDLLRSGNSFAHDLLRGGSVDPGEFDLGRWAESRQQAWLFSPESLCVGLQGKCNLNCPGCYVSRSDAKSPIDRLERIFRQAQRMRVCRVNLGGGEPFMDDYIFEAAQLAREYQLFVSVTTNGTQVNDTLARRIAESSIGHVQVSLDGHSEETHALTRGAGSWADAVAGMRALRRANVDFAVSVLLTRRNYPELLRTVEFALQQGAKSVKILRPKPDGPGKSDWLEANRLESSIRPIVDVIVRAVGPRASLDCAFEPVARGVLGRDHWGHGCIAGRRSLSIGMSGRAFACPFLAQVCGSVTNQSLEDIWRCSAALAEIRSEAGRVDYSMGEGWWSCVGCLSVMQYDNSDADSCGLEVSASA